MPTTSTVDGTAMPAGTDAFSPNVQLKAYQDAAALYNARKIYATTTAMNAETYMVAGWRAYITADSTEYVFDGTIWRLLPADQYLANTATAAFSMGSNSTMYILRGVGSTVAVFGVPTSHQTLTLTGNVYSNGYFSWDRSLGELKVNVAGTYEIEVRATTGTQSAGTVTLGITKNAVSVGATANDLARDDRANSSAVTQSPYARIPAVALGTGDVVRFIAFIFGAGGAVSIGGASPYFGNFRIRRIGD